jgi:hypothetical protein
MRVFILIASPPALPSSLAASSELAWHRQTTRLHLYNHEEHVKLSVTGALYNHEEHVKLSVTGADIAFYYNAIVHSNIFVPLISTQKLNPSQLIRTLFQPNR